MSCTNCSHAKTDHLTGKCVNRQTRFNPAIGAVVTLCPCKTFDEKKKGAADAGGFPATVYGLTAPAESVGTAPAELTTHHAPSTNTTATRKGK